MKLLIMFAISSSAHRLKLLIVRHPEPMFLPQHKRPRFTPIQKKGKIIVLEKRKTKDSGPNDSVTKYVIYHGLGSNKKQNTRLFLCVYCVSCIRVVFQPTMDSILFYLNNIYIIITPTCFDTLASSAGRAEVVLRWSHVVPISSNFR